MVEKKKTTCLFCSLGCSALVSGRRGLYYDKEDPVNRGALCPRGNYVLELLYHPQRLLRPLIGGRETTMEEALASVRQKLKELDPATSAIAVSANAFSEEIYLAAKLARVLGFHFEVTGAKEDAEALQALKWESPAQEADLASDFSEYDALLIVGDLLVRSPVLSRKVNQVKYGARGNQVIVIDPGVSHTAWFATQHLKPNPSTEVAVLAGIFSSLYPEKLKLDLNEVEKLTGVKKDRIHSAAQALGQAKKACLIAVPGKMRQRNDLIVKLVKLLAEAKPEDRYLVQYVHGNALGGAPLLTGFDLNEALSAKKLKALLVFGEDIMNSNPAVQEGVKNLDYHLAADVFYRQADCLLPISAYPESQGMVTLSGGRTEELFPVLPPPGTLSLAELLASLLNTDLDLNKVREELKGLKMAPAPLTLSAELAAVKPSDMKLIEDDIVHFARRSHSQHFAWAQVEEKK